MQFTPKAYETYQVGIFKSESWEEVLNTDDKKYWGSGMTNSGAVIKVDKKPYHGRDFSIKVKIPPLGVCILRPKSKTKAKTTKRKPTKTNLKTKAKKK